MTNRTFLLLSSLLFSTTLPSTAFAGQIRCPEGYAPSKTQSKACQKTNADGSISWHGTVVERKKGNIFADSLTQYPSLKKTIDPGVQDAPQSYLISKIYRDGTLVSFDARINYIDTPVPLELSSVTRIQGEMQDENNGKVRVKSGIPVGHGEYTFKKHLWLVSETKDGQEIVTANLRKKSGVCVINSQLRVDVKLDEQGLITEAKLAPAPNGSTFFAELQKISFKSDFSDAIGKNIGENGCMTIDRILSESLVAQAGALEKSIGALELSECSDVSNKDLGKTLADESRLNSALKEKLVSEIKTGAKLKDDLDAVVQFLADAKKAETDEEPVAVAKTPAEVEREAALGAAKDRLVQAHKDSVLRKGEITREITASTDRLKAVYQQLKANQQLAQFRNGATKNDPSLFGKLLASSFEKSLKSCTLDLKTMGTAQAACAADQQVDFRVGSVELYEIEYALEVENR